MQIKNRRTSFKVITVVGARPQFVKAAALSPSLRATKMIDEIIVHTGQHFDHSMSDIFFHEMNIPAPTVNLGVGGGTHGQNTGRMIEGLEKVFLEHKPDGVLVYGDTDSTLAASIAASKLGLYLAHVEAGLRSFRRAMPEEINRVLTDHVSDVLYAPSAHAVELLAKEGISGEKVVNAGDVMFDVVNRFSSVAKNSSNVLERLCLHPQGYNLLTLHRKENVDDPEILRRVLDVIGVSRQPTVFLVHPRTAKMLDHFEINVSPLIQLVEPVGYIDMIRLIQNCSVVLTDSGGLQKEAYFLGRPCITLRDETEWTELVDVGANILVGTDPIKIEKAVESMISLNSVPYGIYGQGNAADLISQDLLMRLKKFGEN
ncbi:UDP-N-acetylglucosamine 2-epimerase (non-hydrolyzing) [Comamonas sp. lk]|uniref:non-hydrolyzing UDP-N-acetylglucosamine 2-epimerase n=1 Tax=Comamonas sp. lk TaxID=2201272 RepID=UPI000EAF8CEF|nr:UDP-N-acetylglucosamine 2-epimerase (non-hydrolyzing) [Comamonas sp. lk]